MNFKEAAAALQPELMEIRHHLHRHPELSLVEWETTRFLVEKLEQLNIPVTTFADYPGCIAHIRGGKPGKTILLRADIDALPTEEHSGVEFASENPGVMHACGHDVHTTTLLGAAKLLKDAEPEISGNVELLFQSGEEAFIGSHYYEDKGYLKDVDFVYGAHVWPDYPTGTIAVSDGNRMAACDNFVITVHGVSAHGSTPHFGKDAIVCASSIVMNLQTLVSRFNDPLNPLVVTVGKIDAGTQFNIITDTAVMEGTIRTYDLEILKQVPVEFRKIVESTAAALGCTVEIAYDHLEEPVINDQLADNEIARQAAAKIVGGEHVLNHVPAGMGSEDFGYLMIAHPGCFGNLGCRDEAMGAVWSLHSDKFKINEEILQYGAGHLAQFAFDWLEQKAKEAAE